MKTAQQSVQNIQGQLFTLPNLQSKILNEEDHMALNICAQLTSE